MHRAQTSPRKAVSQLPDDMLLIDDDFDLVEIEAESAEVLAFPALHAHEVEDWEDEIELT